AQPNKRLTRTSFWRDAYELTLHFADAIRRGDRIDLTAVLQEGPADAGTGPADRLYWIRRTYPSIADLLDVPASQSLDTARRIAAEQSRHLAQRAQAFEEDAAVAAEIADLPAAPTARTTTHQAIDACAEHARRTYEREGKTSQWGLKLAESLERLKRSMPDMPLAQLNYDSLEQARNYWTARPKGLKTGRPIALDTVRGQLKALRHFVRFLHRSATFDWQQPPAAEDALKVNYKRLRTSQEIAAIKDGVKTWMDQELVTLYVHARDRERVLMLLALNCGFAAAEIRTLRMSELDLDAGAIKRVRQKTLIYGEWALWPETCEAINWWRRHHRRGKAKELAFVTERGRELTTQFVANMWNTLVKRVQQYEAGFRRLPFKHLRKTAGQFIREAADGETMAVFHARGQSVATDDLAEVYTNRLFPRVFDAQQKVRERLKPMFTGAIDPFMTFKRGGGRPASPGVQRMIRDLHARGTDVADIAQAVGMARQSVYRYLPQERESQKRRLNKDDINRIRQMRVEGQPLKEIASAIGCSIASASRHAAQSPVSD
ncbi:MAG: helix-turn-helix domain-containing protein, partial [Phycisphaeraceae bacterium]